MITRMTSESRAIPTEEVFERACTTIGKVIILGAHLDERLTSVLTAACHLLPSVALGPIVSSIEFNRKIAILKSRAKHITNADWRKPILTFAGEAEKFYKMRNIAAHCVLSRSGDDLVLQPIGAYALFCGLDLKRRAMKRTSIAELASFLPKGEALVQTAAEIASKLENINQYLRQSE